MEVAYRFNGISHIAHYHLWGTEGSQAVTVDHEGRSISAKLNGIEACKVAEVLMGELVRERWDEDVKEGKRRDRLALEEAQRVVDRQSHFTGL